MAKPERTIFRVKALEHYLQGREKTILPRFVKPPVILCLWALLILLIVTGWLVWWGEIPAYASGTGVVVSSSAQQQQTFQGASVVVFLPPAQLPLLHQGQPVQIYVDAGKQPVRGTVAVVEPGIVSPLEARTRFQLDDGSRPIITHPSAIILVQAQALQAETYAGSIVPVQVQIGQQRLIMPLVIASK